MPLAGTATLSSEPAVVRFEGEGRALVPVGSQDLNGARALPSGTYHCRIWLSKRAPSDRTSPFALKGTSR